VRRTDERIGEPVAEDCREIIDELGFREEIDGSTDFLEPLFINRSPSCSTLDSAKRVGEPQFWKRVTSHRNVIGVLFSAFRQDGTAARR